MCKDKHPSVEAPPCVKQPQVYKNSPKWTIFSLIWPILRIFFAIMQRPLSLLFCKFFGKDSHIWAYLDIFDRIWVVIWILCTVFHHFFFGYGCPRRTGNVFGSYFHARFPYFLRFLLLCRLFLGGLRNAMDVCLARAPCVRVCAARCARYG